LLGRAFAVNPRSPQGRALARGVDGESAGRAIIGRAMNASQP